MPKTLFISDTHFGHENIIRYCSRPFSNVDEMDDHMIRQWNHVVGPDDTVYHIGDFCFGSIERVKRYRYALRGIIHLVMGNHDRHSPNAYKRCGFESVWRESVIVNQDNKSLRLAHRPDFRNGTELVYRFLHGHVHNKLPIRPTPITINCSVEVLDYRPRTLEELAVLL